MKRQNRRHRDEQERELNLWLKRRNRTRGWQHWTVWRVIFWAILIGTALVTVEKYYAYR